MKLKAFLDYLNGLSILIMEKDHNHEYEGEIELFNKILNVIKTMLTKKEMLRYKSYINGIKNNLNKKKKQRKNTNLIKNLEKEFKELRGN